MSGAAGRRRVLYDLVKGLSSLSAEEQRVGTTGVPLSDPQKEALRWYQARLRAHMDNRGDVEVSARDMNRVILLGNGHLLRQALGELIVEQNYPILAWGIA